MANDQVEKDLSVGGEIASGAAEKAALLDYAEEEGQRLINFHLENLDNLKSQAHKLLWLLVVSIGASLGYTLSLFENGASTGWLISVSILTGYLAITATYVVIMCLMTGWVLPPTNEPKNLYQPDYPLDTIREINLQNLQSGIDHNQARADRIGFHLNVGWLLTAAAPFVFALVLWLLT